MKGTVKGESSERKKKSRQTWRHTPLIPATQEAEAEAEADGSL